MNNLSFYLKLIIACFLVLPVSSFGQTDTTYFDQDWNKTEHASAYYYRLATKQADGGYKVEDHYIFRRKLQMSGYYSSLEPEVKNGDFVFYNEKGIKTSVQHYQNNKLQGISENYNDSTGKLESIESYKDDKPIGVWKYYYANTDTIWHEDTYDDKGQCRHINSYYKNGNKKREEELKDGKTVGGKCWSENGKEIEFTPFTVLPAFSGDMNLYLASNVHYPNVDREKGAQGRVIIKFVIYTDGTIHDINIVHGVTETIDNEAIRVVNSMPRWKPGMQDDKPAKIFFTLPIRFTLVNDK